jgi:hypothetical protein
MPCRCLVVCLDRLFLDVILNAFLSVEHQSSIFLCLVMITPPFEHMYHRDTVDVALPLDTAPLQTSFCTLISRMLMRSCDLELSFQISVSQS